MSLNDFKKMIGWLKKQKISHLVLTGGEPTSHPNFDKIMEIFHQENFALDLVTNCLFGKKILKKINNVCVKYLVADYLPKQSSNLNYNKYINNIEAIYNKGIPIHFFCRIPLEKSNQEDLIKKLEKYSATTSLRFIMPGFSGKKTSIQKRKKETKKIVPFLLLLKEKNMNFSLYDPLLRCALSDEEWMKLRKFGIKLRTVCSSLKYPLSWEERKSYLDRLTIAPDLSIFPCYALFFQGPSILSFKNTEEINILFKKFFEKWRWEVPIMKECKSCKYYSNKECQGGCLNYKYHKKYKGKIVRIENELL
jgi:radical SAM protein with 4Fe4S-binding SPASM domain